MASAVSGIMLTVLLMSMLTMALNITSVKAEEPALVTILNALNFKNIEESSVETFMLGTYNVTLYAEFADYHASNELSWYAVGTTDYNLVYSGPEGNFGNVNPPINKSFTTNNTFGLSFLSPEARYFTETGKNPDGIKHAVIYVNLDDPDMYLIGFENKLGGGDGDYNDMVLSLKLAPAVVNISGANWYIRNATNDNAFIFLDGGGLYGMPYELRVSVHSFDYSHIKKKEKVLFINDLVQNGFDALVNKDTLYYWGNETWLKDAALWLWEQGYNNVFLFGFSAGGVVVAYEIQKEYASTLFSAAVVAAAPVDYDPITDEKFQSAHTANRTKVCTSFIAGENDMILGNITKQMQLYYNNTLVHKEWHTWADGHDVFLNTCKDHLGETVFDATYDWYQHTHELTVNTRTTEGSEITRVNVWVDGIRYSSPVNIILGAGAHTVQAELYFYRRVYWLYMFDHWEDGSTNNTRNVPVSSNMTITAYYVETYCPTLFVWNGTDYVYEAFLDIRGDSDVTLQHRIQHPLVKDGIFYKLSLLELDEFTSHIDQVRLYAVNSQGEWNICPLISAVQSEQGWVTLKLRFDDETMVDLAPTQTINLKFTYFEDDIAYFTFEINGHNKKLP